jgi:hypothetical protein
VKPYPPALIGFCSHAGVTEFMAMKKPKFKRVKTPSTTATGVKAILKGIRQSLICGMEH